MKYEMMGQSDNALVHVSLRKGEIIKIESGAMVYSQDVSIEGKLNTKKKGFGGILSAAARSLTSGESLFMTYATGASNEGYIGIAPSVPGRIRCLQVGSQQYCLNTSAFLACDENVNYVMKKQDIGKAIFGGTGGLFVMETEGSGDVLVNSFGDILELTVTSAKPLTIDNEHVVAWDRSLNYQIKVASGTFGFKTGEGLVNEFHGNGKVWIQTRNIHSLAEVLTPFLPKASN